jgi:hypothetical protein
MDVKKLDGYFRPKGIRMMLWGDMMLTKAQSSDAAANAVDEAQARQMRDAIPKDAVICDWHYQPTKVASYKSLAIFKDDGLQTIASTWYNPLNISYFATAARKNDSLGLLETTWAGYNIDERAMHKEFKQFSAYILAAEYAWSGQETLPDDLPYRADEVFARAFNPVRAMQSKRAGMTVDLSGALNLKLDDDSVGLSTLPIDQRFAGVQFDLHTRRAVALNGALLSQSLPRSVDLKFTASPSAIAFLQATAFRADVGDEVGAYEMTYSDGIKLRVPLLYGVNIRAVDDVATTSDAVLAWSGKSSHGVAVGVRVFMWSNPHPDKPIQSITFSTNHSYASPMLIGLTGLNDAEMK